MSKPPSRLESLLPYIEAVIWIVIAVFARRGVDLLAARWRVLEPWITLMKIAGVLALIGIAVWIHNLIYGWLARKGWIRPE